MRPVLELEKLRDGYRYLDIGDLWPFEVGLKSVSGFVPKEEHFE